jgi:hypothetical protein
MNSDTTIDTEVPHIPDAFADAWAAVYIDVYEKLKERGELPDDDTLETSPQSEEELDAVNNHANEGEPSCCST